MHSEIYETPVGSVDDIFLYFLERGARLWTRGDKLNYKIPVSSVVLDEIGRLDGRRPEMLAILNGTNVTECIEPEVASPQRIDYAPLAFSQLMHWRLHELRKRRSARIVSLAVRLSGALDLEALNSSIEVIINRHEALRTRIGIVGDKPVQVIFGSFRSEMNIDDLSVLPRSVRENALQLLFQKYVLEPIDVTMDALFATRLVRIASDEHVLIAAMDHLISDGASIEILWRDLLEEYAAAVCHSPSLLPEVSVQFPDYAVWQRAVCSGSNDVDVQRWNIHLSECAVLAHRHDNLSGGLIRCGLGYVPIRIDAELKVELIRWCRARQTTLVMGALTAFCALVLRWYKALDGVIQYQTNGRHMTEVRNTIGYFAFRLYLRACLLEGDTFAELLDRIKSEFIVASELGEHYSLHASIAKPEIVRSPCFNWFTHDSTSREPKSGEQKGGIFCSRVRYEDQITELDDFKTDTELMVGIREANDGLIGTVMFDNSVISRDSAEQFGRNFLVFLKALIRDQEIRAIQIELVP